MWVCFRLSLPYTSRYKDYTSVSDVISGCIYNHDWFLILHLVFTLCLITTFAPLFVLLNTLELGCTSSVRHRQSVLLSRLSKTNLGHNPTPAMYLAKVFLKDTSVIVLMFNKRSFSVFMLRFEAGFIFWITDRDYVV